MKIKLNKEMINDITKLSNSIINQNAINDILKTMKIELKDNVINFNVANETSSAKVYFNVLENENKVVYVNANLFSGIISNLDECELSLNDNNLEIKSNSFKSKLNIIDIEYDLNIDIDEKKKIFTTTKSELDIITNILIKTIGSDNILQNIYFKNNNGNIVGMTTNSFIACFLKNIEFSNIDNFNEIIIEPKFIKNILNNNLNDYVIDFFEAENHIIAIFGNKIIKNKKIDFGKYPNIENHFNANIDYKLSVDSNNLLKAVERGSVLVETDATPTININVDDNTLKINFNSSQLGSATELININDSIEFKYKAYFNLKLLLSFLKQLDNGITEIEIVNKKQWLLSNNSNFKYLILPLNK